MNNEMNENIIISLITALGAVLAAFFGKSVYGRNKQNRLTPEEEIYIQHLSPLGSSLGIMEEQANNPDSGIDRAVMLEGHNCGGFPDPKRPYYVDIVYPVISDDPNNNFLSVKAIKDKYSSLQVDSHHIDLLSELIRVKDKILVTAEMEDCLLKEIFISEKISWSLFSYLCLHGQSIIFITQSCHLPTLSPTEDQIFSAKLAANKLRNLMIR